MKQRLPKPSQMYWAARTAGYVAAQRRVPYLKPEQLRRLCDARARSMVDHAWRTVPFYRRAMQERGLEPRHFHGVSDLGLLPVVHGRDLADRPEHFLSSAYTPDNTLELLTSGSTGHSKRIHWDKAAVFQAHAAGLRHREVLAGFTGQRSGYRLLMVNSAGSTNSDVREFHQRHSWVPTVVDPQTVYVSPREPFEQAVQAINAHRPEVVRGFGAYLGAIYRWAWSGGYPIHLPKVICFGGEHMHEADRQLIESVYGVPVITSYQSCEAMRMAFQCKRGSGLHISADQTHIRVAGPDGHTLPDGETGRVLMSNLVNRATVLLNYDLGDRGAMSPEFCDCGRTLPMLERLEGRDNDFVILPDGQVAHGSAVLSQLYRVPGLLRLQFIQHSHRELEVKVVCNDDVDWNEMQRGLDKALTRALGPHSFAVTWRRVKRIEPGPGGKYKCMISRVRPDTPPGR
ncbi:MAG: hypothetical protein KJN78_03200 [Gammaproteobacteria bacterium]|nr:hypothetical protein [Gammaproteobacteria bacterium]